MDMKNALDSMPRKVIECLMRQKGLPEMLVKSNHEPI